ncbi:MAG: lysophospholipid acyltransferase family protein [Acidobacteria bacterium]|nr:lysophospholipid acyltransferase family protein [Acidobacteriota bacterium]
MAPYRLLRGLLRISVRVFFRRIEVVGLEHVPRTGAVVFFGNHPNSLLDPALICCFCERVVRFVAKDVLFRSPLLRPVLRAMGAVPVQRRADHGEAPLANELAFERLFAVLGASGAIGIFPEGLSHDASQLARFKTGAARIALGTRERHPGLALRLVPCGLTYMTPQRFRSSVLVQFGPALEIAPPSAAAFRADPRGAARELTERMEASLRALTVNAEDWETLRVLDGVRRLYQPPRISLDERVELARRFATHYPSLRHEPEIERLYGHVADYLDRLGSVGLTDRDLGRELRPGEGLLRLLRHLVLVLVWLPAALAGAPVHLPVGLLLGITGERLSPRKDVIGTTKFVAGFLLLALAYLGLPALLGLRFGWRAAAVALVLLPLSGYGTLRVLERVVALRRLAKTSLRLLFLRREVEALRKERAALVDDVVETVQRFKPEGLELLFPRPSPLASAE